MRTRARQSNVSSHKIASDATLSSEDEESSGTSALTLAPYTFEPSYDLNRDSSSSDGEGGDERMPDLSW